MLRYVSEMVEFFTPSLPGLLCLYLRKTNLKEYSKSENVSKSLIFKLGLSCFKTGFTAKTRFYPSLNGTPRQKHPNREIAPPHPPPIFALFSRALFLPKAFIIGVRSTDVNDVWWGSHLSARWSLQTPGTWAFSARVSFAVTALKFWIRDVIDHGT